MIYTMVHKKRATCHFYLLNSNMQHWLILIFSACNIQKKLDTNNCIFGHLTSILPLPYLVKCRLSSLLFPSGVNICHLHSCWRKTFWAHAVIKRMWRDTCDIWHTIVANRVCRFSVNHFWDDACSIPYKFIAVNGQTMTYPFHKVM